MCIKAHIYNALLLAGLLCLWLMPHSVSAQGVSSWGPSDPSVQNDCGIYQWPPQMLPCPEVQIKQKWDHTPMKQYKSQGWDTAVTCLQHTIELSCMPYIPVQNFSGYYTVDTIPYDPPDPTFARGTKMPVSTDDDFAATATPIPFSFFFFGQEKDAFVLGANGLITFNTNSAGKYCPWKYSAPAPWGNENTTGAPKGLGCTVANMRDAIYGIYEDTHPIASYLHGDQGIYYGVQDEYPCRKIICSWNGIPTFPGSRNQNNRCTYQIVCYEGSNIIEVHVKRRGVNSAWQGGKGLLAIQNATGQLQVHGDPGTSTMFVQDGAPAAYYPAGCNLTTSQMDSIAFRFTPHDIGTPQKTYSWYRIFDDGRDSIPLTTDVTDTNGYFTPMGSRMPSCPNLTTAVVHPTEVSRYVFNLRFSDAGGNRYDLYDTITIGVDNSALITLRPSGADTSQHQLDICSGTDARLTIEYPGIQDTHHVVTQLVRVHNGMEYQLPDSLLILGQLYEDEETGLKRIPTKLISDSTALHLHPGDIDSIYVRLSVDFVSGCHNTAELLVRLFPAYDTVERYAICKGETFHWTLNGQDYSESTTTPQVNIPTVGVGCDSVIHLNLWVSDTSHTIVNVSTCKPYTWINGQTYSENNNATTNIDTVHLTNLAGCDSLVQLAFTIYPLTPLISADHDYIDYNNLDVVFTDVSIGGDNRTWIFPTGEPQYGVTARYTAPVGVDSITITMVEQSLYGCVDTAYITLPFHSDVIWVPNVFTPGRTDGNDNMLFGSVSRHLVKEQTVIYNRHGEKVFECHEIDCKWDGTDLRGKPCGTGGYMYVIRYITEFEPRVTHVLKGSVTLVR